MLYRQMGRTGDELSILGYGCMRLPCIKGKIDEIRTEAQIISAVEKGVNYFDTAYLYHQGKSEVVLGKVLSKGYRDKVRIATKLLPLMVNSRQDMEGILSTQLKRLLTDHIDYYLIHSLIDRKTWDRLKESGIIEFLEEEKRKGTIRHTGFSFHGDRNDFKAIVDDYPWEFCQIQLNYLDIDSQAGLEGLRYAASKGLGVIIMEPLRGGNLVGKMPDEVRKIWEQAEIKRTPAEWALRWLWNFPEVSIVLSGMNEESHIEENIRIAGEASPNSLKPEELALVEKVREVYGRLMKIGCTGCGYCLPCPSGVDIPTCFSLFNSKYLFNDKTVGFQYLLTTGGFARSSPSYASLCRDCGKCEKKCPQQLPVRENLKKVTRELQGPFMKPLIWVARQYLGFRRLLKSGKGS